MQNADDPRLFWIGLSSVPGVGRATFRKLVARFGSPERALHASPGELSSVDGVSRRAIDAIGSFAWRETAGSELAKAAAAGVGIITADDTAYPANLKDIADPPLYLYVRGGFVDADNNAVAIVGTRNPSHYGRSVTARLAAELASAGLTIVSGLARGIDTEAHRGALTARGRTIAVLGCGIDVAYPPENRPLIEQISRTGVVVTENPFGTKPEAGYFPARNRIISGLSRGTVIIEATSDSGSLITAQYAGEQGRKIFAVPGNAGAPTSRGTNNLIKQGTTLVENATDILAGLGAGSARGHAAAPGLPSLTDAESAVLRCVTEEPRHIDVLMRECRLAAGALSGVLISLEMKGLVKQFPGKYFIRSA